MNIKLVYKDCHFNLDVMEDTPCQYLYRVAQKVFRKKQSDLILFYGIIKIENDSRLLFDIMGKDDKEDILDEEIITVKHKKDCNDFNNEIKYRLKSLNKINSKNNNSEQFPIIDNNNTLSPIHRNKNKKIPIRCQICSHKNSIFYCRECNIFICFECNIRYSEHHRHKRISIEDGDTSLGIQIYKEKILGELKIIDSGYKKFSKWVISNVERDNFLQTTFKLLDKVKRNSQRLSDIHTLYNIDQSMINNVKSDVEQTKIPVGQEELIELFNNLNSKDKEIENYIKCVDLQIIKTEYNKVLVKCISNAQKHFKKIIEDVESKLRECEDMKFWGITEVKLYLKDHKKEKINFDIFNNEENMKNENNKNEFADSSAESSVDNDNEELRKFKMNLNSNNDAFLNSPQLSGVKKSGQNNESNNDNNLDSKFKKTVIKLIKTTDNISNRKNYGNNPIKIKSPKKRKATEMNDNKNDDLNMNNNHNDDNDFSNTINTKTRNKFNPVLKISNTLRNEDTLLNKNDDIDITSRKKGNNLIKSLMTSFSGDNKEKKYFFSPNRMDTNNEYPLILTNRNKGDKNDNNEKYLPSNFKKYKNSGNYGKKLNNVLRQKTSKKD